jgi:hypothetical protein
MFDEIIELFLYLNGKLNTLTCTQCCLREAYCPPSSSVKSFAFTFFIAKQQVKNHHHNQLSTIIMQLSPTIN